ncbi:hypothetical protein LWI28_025885 [Acer negundo]|uniref:Diacylglycerol O-acyltransferase n=1 Tax=Acer negundo TaxID=4023 RepID=A0AAD5IUF0_ACENE|nr:hypothetical protein LWI28_007327 [Acer negundo]KAI9178389.1 hypothetical protein LWI28_025885 [Acer negundo]
MESEGHQEEKTMELEEPVSPTGQYFNSSVLSICVLAVLESEIPVDDSSTMSLLQDVFLPINPRFSSIMVSDKNGVKKWKKFDVNLKDHVHVPIFPSGLSLKCYDDYLNEYLSRIAKENLPQSRPLWEIHIFKYPTKNAAGTVVFKLHHALGDGFSLMGALLSCLQRADNPSLPLTFPTLQWPSKMDNQNENFFLGVPRFLSSACNTVSDFGWSLLKSSCVEDDRTPIRSADPGVEFKPVTITTITFSLDHINQIKTKLGVTLNDVITGIIFFGTRLYMQSSSKKNNAHSTALVLLNTRNIGGYKSVKEMVKPDAESPWGNQFGFLHVSIPEPSSTDADQSPDPLEFVLKAQKIIKRKRSSLAVKLTGRLLEALRKFIGPEATARYIHTTLKNSSMTISNLIGPVEQMALSDHPIKGLYFMVVGVPQSLTITMLSYMGKMRIAVGTEKGFIEPQKFQGCIENAFERIFKAAHEIHT